MQLGDRIRKLRLEQNRTLDDVSLECGFSKSLLSKIENGKTVPAVATLMKIAKSLGVKVSVLLDDDEFVGTVHTVGNVIENNMIQTNKGYSFFPIAVERRDKLMQPFMFQAKKGELQTKLSHEGEEFIYVLQGILKYTVGGIEYRLSAGDSLYFDSIQEHKLSPITDKVQYLAVFTNWESP